MAFGSIPISRLVVTSCANPARLISATRTSAEAMLTRVANFAAVATVSVVRPTSRMAEATASARPDRMGSLVPIKT